MALARDMSKAQMAFQVAGRDIDQFMVIRFRGTEGLCQLYRFEIELATTEEGLVLDSIVGRPAVLSINTREGERWFHGIVGRFEMTGETVGQTYFRAELVPSVWLLTHRYHSRIFQDKTVKDIILQVLTEGGVASDQIKFLLTQQYEPRVYCTQYRETDYNFICRLMEEEGIWWHFEHSQEEYAFVMADSASAYAPIEGGTELPYRPPTGMNVAEDHVFRFRMSQSVRPGAVVLNDYNFENPKLKLEAKDDADRDTGLAFNDFPGEFMDERKGTAMARLRKEEFQVTRRHAAGQSNSKFLVPAKKFKLTDHPSENLNTSYLLTSVTHQGKEATLRTTTGTFGRTSVLDARVHQSLVAARTNDNRAIVELAEALLQIASRLRAGDPTARRALTSWLYHAGQVSKDLPSTAGASGGNPLEWLTIPNLIEDIAQSSVVDYDSPEYECSFSCIPATVTYRPPRVTPWPVMRGTQTARVVGPKGEEIYTDKYGRVKVQFDWDRQGNEAGQPKLFGADSSCWIRVSQGSAGGQYGIMFIPRIGQEVVVDYLEGDPDKPIITGRVYNADHMPPYELPKEKTKSVIKTHSTLGGGGTNEIRFEDLKKKEQLFIQAQRQMDTRVKANHYHTIGGSYHVLVGGVDKDGNLYGELRELIYEAKHVHIKGEMRTWIEKNEGRIVGGDQSTDIGGTRSTHVAKDVVEIFDVNHKTEVGATYDCKAMAIKLEASTGIELKCGGSSIILTPAAIFIQAPLVNINTGAGPPVAPVAAVGMSPPVPDDAAAADSSEPGKDTRYDGAPGVLAPAEPAEEVPGHEFDEDEPTERETSWIEIELVDEIGNPIAGERYDVTTPDGSIKRGVTDANGRARIANIEPGECQISFPRLDEQAWERQT